MFFLKEVSKDTESLFTKKYLEKHLEISRNKQILECYYYLMPPKVYY